MSLKKLQIYLDIFFIQKMSIGHKKYPKNFFEKIANLSGHILYQKNVHWTEKISSQCLEKLQIYLDIFYIQKISIGHKKYPQNVLRKLQIFTTGHIKVIL